MAFTERNAQEEGGAVTRKFEFFSRKIVTEKYS